MTLSIFIHSTLKTDELYDFMVRLRVVWPELDNCFIFHDFSVSGIPEVDPIVKDFF